ncbi:nicotinate-nicotinamide nucleotide adenylyltransferase [Aliiglaciecola sp. 3_MG-2023]|uniref:nicotinate-nicotinamide nucleotide adenylyltransferase n=1 Tax=Aliiglaciecola sp. 3_MG-2023 TaxID=3062644 RepID=UPI0026E3687D|nr:nicotinate-nicotinamide nucleotide adenylyltransferase [Aliiglaciecola sp. 3_MG-2023]MDO6693789.1 nicotinate-nicotinamide nucleotide adenylyltransferase [Aliiglaciecola sp. 3_MG-2023]
MKIAIFGAAFNPPTLGHQDAIEYISAQHPSFDSILLIPSYAHAFSKKMLSYEHRVSMLHLFAQQLNDPKVEVFPVEEQLSDGTNPIYTFDLLTYLQAEYFPDAKLTFVMGPDNKVNWHKFYKSQEVTDNWEILVVPERVAIRSTEVRNNLINHQNIDNQVPKEVAQYINQHDLYVNSPPHS